MASEKIKLNADLSIDLHKLVESRLLIQANSGGGKSWAIRRIIEQAFGKVQIIVLDPEGEFTNLRQKYDFVIAGKGGDAPAESRSAGLLATKLLETKASAIIDLYELPPQERKHFVRLFVESMVNAPKELWHDCLVIIDEAHVFVPERGDSEAMGPVIDLATRGRKRGFCAILATQRLPKLHKDAAAECNNKLIGRCSQDIDRKRAGEELGFTGKEQVLSLRQLRPGEFYAFGPAICDDVTKTQIGDISIKPAPRGARGRATPPPATEKVKKVLAKLADLPKEAEEEARTVSELRQKVRSLETAQRAVKPPAPVTKTETIEKIVIKKVPVLKDSQIQRLEQAFARMIKEAERHGGAMSLLWGHFEEAGKAMVLALEAIAKSQREPIVQAPPPVPPRAVMPVRVPLPAAAPRQQQEIELPAGALKSGAKRMLEVLATRSPLKLTRSQLALMSKMSSSSGTFTSYLSVLRKAAFIIEEDDTITASPEGMNYLGVVPSAPQTAEQLIDMWRQNLKAGCWRMLEILLETREEIVREDLAQRAGMEATSGTFTSYLSVLRKNGLIKERGKMVYVTPDFFV